MSTTISREFIHQLLNRIEIVDLIDKRVPLRKKSNNNFFACCPFHQEKTPSFSVSQAKQFYYCFGCGVHGNAIDFIMQRDRLTFPETIEILAKEAGLPLPEQSGFKKTTTDTHQQLYEILSRAMRYYQQELKASKEAIHYLKARGVTGNIAKLFKIGFAPPHWENLLSHFGKALEPHLCNAGLLIKKESGHYYDRFRNRILFPIEDRRGRVIGFGGRVIDEGEPKYLNSPETAVFSKGHELYGLHQVLQMHTKLPQALLVEGYMDVIQLFQHDITYAVASLGTATTTHHIERLARYTTTIIFCFDGDTAGRSAAFRALQVALPIMRDDVQIKFMFLPEGDDPDSLVRKEGKILFEKRMQQAMTFSQFFFKTIAEQTDLSTVEGRARFTKLATDKLALLPPGILQNMMLEEVAKKTRVDKLHFAQSKKSMVPKAKKVRPPSALRLALTMLVQDPLLAKALIEPLKPLNLTGFSLLTEVLKIIREHEVASTGHLLEYFRERQEYATLVKLAHHTLTVPENGVKSEFLGAISRLNKMAVRQMINNLLAKAAITELTLEEKSTLNFLINNKT